MEHVLLQSYLWAMGLVHYSFWLSTKKHVEQTCETRKANSQRNLATHGLEFRYRYLCLVFYNYANRLARYLYNRLTGILVFPVFNDRICFVPKASATLDA